MHLHIPAFMGVQPALLTINDDASMALVGHPGRHRKAAKNYVC
jgi:hypothetical protein